MATMIVSPLLARVVGQASRRGLILRVPSGESLLESVEAWLLAEYGDSVRSMSRRAIEGGDAELSVALHPAAPNLVMSAGESGRVALTAETETMGPGYHRFIGRLVERLGEDLSITWDRGEPDPGAILDDAGTTFADRVATERAYLGWLGQTLVKARAGRARTATQLQIGIPGTTRYTFDGAIATVLGPRDDAWLEAAVADTRVATDITPWWADATDGQTLLNRALTLMWLDVRWRAPAIKEERELLTRSTGRSPGPTRPTRRSPTRGGRGPSSIEFRGIDDPMSRQVLVRAEREGGDAAPIGYRRAPVTIRHEGWALEIPGSYAERRTPEEWWGGGLGRSITLAAVQTGDRRRRDGRPGVRRPRRRRPRPRRHRPSGRRRDRPGQAVDRHELRASRSASSTATRRSSAPAPRSGSCSTTRATGSGRSTCGGRSRRVEGPFLRSRDPETHSLVPGSNPISALTRQTETQRGIRLLTGPTAPRPEIELTVRGERDNRPMYVPPTSSRTTPRS